MTWQRVRIAPLRAAKRAAAVSAAVDDGNLDADERTRTDADLTAANHSRIRVSGGGNATEARPRAPLYIQNVIIYTFHTIAFCAATVNSVKSR